MCVRLCASFKSFIVPLKMLISSISFNANPIDSMFPPADVRTKRIKKTSLNLLCHTHYRHSARAQFHYDIKAVFSGIMTRKLCKTGHL